MRHLLNLGPSTFSGQTGPSWAASKENIQEGFWWQEMSSEDLLALGSHGDKELFSVLGTMLIPEDRETPGHGDHSDTRNGHSAPA